MIKTIVGGVGLNGGWLREEGLRSFKLLWLQLAPLRRITLDVACWALW